MANLRFLPHVAGIGGATRTTQFFTEQARITAAQIFTPSIGRQSLPLLLRKDSYYVRLPLRVDQGN